VVLTAIVQAPAPVPGEEIVAPVAIGMTTGEIGLVDGVDLPDLAIEGPLFLEAALNGPACFYPDRLTAVTHAVRTTRDTSAFVIPAETMAGALRSAGALAIASGNKFGLIG
jgi:hypothetical protein